MLTRSFNSMTLQLGESRAEGERKEKAIAHAKAQLESILTNLSAGVLAFDEALKLQDRLYPLHAALFTDASPAPAKYALGRVRPGFQTRLARGAPARRQAKQQTAMRHRS